MFSPKNFISPFVILYEGCPAMIFERVLLPHPFLPIMAWISPGYTVIESPFKIGRLSVDAKRF